MLSVLQSKEYFNKLKIDIGIKIKAVRVPAFAELKDAEYRLLEEINLKTQEFGTGDHPSIMSPLLGLLKLYQIWGKEDIEGTKEKGIQIIEKITRLYRLALEKQSQSLTPSQDTTDWNDIQSPWYNIGDFFRYFGEYEQCQHYWQLDIDEWKSNGGSNQKKGNKKNKSATNDNSDNLYASQLGTKLNNLGEVYRLQAKLSEAIKIFEEAVAIQRKALGERHNEVAAVLNNMAGVFLGQGNHEQSLKLFEEVLQIRRENGGNKQPLVAAALHNMAVVYRAQNNTNEALKLLEEALAIQKETLGEAHPEVASTYAHMASCYMSQRNYSEAMKLNEQALNIQKQILGEYHPDIATTLIGMANVQQLQGQFGGAMKTYQDALNIKRKVFGNQHPDVAGILVNIGLLLNGQGEYKLALPYFEEGVQIFQQVLGNDHPTTKKYENYKEQCKKMIKNKTKCILS